VQHFLCNFPVATADHFQHNTAVAAGFHNFAKFRTLEVSKDDSESSYHALFVDGCPRCGKGERIDVNRCCITYWAGCLRLNKRRIILNALTKTFLLPDRPTDQKVLSRHTLCVVTFDLLFCTTHGSYLRSFLCNEATIEQLNCSLFITSCFLPLLMNSSS